MQLTKKKDFSNLPLSDIKEDLNIDQTDTKWDGQVYRLIKSAVAIAEDFTSTDIVPTFATIEEDWFLYPFSFLSYRINEPSAVISAITITNSSNVTSVLDPLTYHIERNNTYCLIRFNNTISGKKLVITYTSGYSEIPEPIKRAISVKVGELFDIDRNGYTQNGLVKSQLFERILAPYIV